ncbi:uncharacterized protein PHACADRAFT_193887 [Phanerochaete carnosa HHB-10118-sp]|uniref:DUF6533 domain-containing protein n=1 Tax=Phanerochaete carnosa (strain HHB-10118-sp) TaxID=650164 RepID=K5X0H6_PHACS|nr:uncharacterized protein PHACADRAFT_193887 [Phanerochaete carnosa HHB-10118-sp]EKM56267.1 hypothetical protein PHACADRAFT_193887 [Phanerochaete carnosa HHB-10118-sp]
MSLISDEPPRAIPSLKLSEGLGMKVPAAANTSFNNTTAAVADIPHHSTSPVLMIGDNVLAVVARIVKWLETALLALNVVRLIAFSSTLFEVNDFLCGSLSTVDGDTPPDLSPALLAQRSMLNLRQLGPAGGAGELQSDTRRPSRFSVNLRVPSDFLRNIGEPLDHGQSENVQEDEDDDDDAVDVTGEWHCGSEEGSVQQVNWQSCIGLVDANDMASLNKNYLTQELRDYLTVNYVECSLVCLAIYEFVITFNQEIKVVWKRKFTATSLLLLGLRWVMLPYPILAVLPAKQAATWRNDLSLFLAILALTSRLFSALRVYALWHESRMKHLFFAFVLTFGLAVPIGTNFWSLARTAVAPEDLVLLSVCNAFIDVPQRLDKQSTSIYLARGCAIAADAAVLVLTWVKSFGHFREMRRLKLRSSITAILLRDGTVYFMTLLVLNILQVRLTLKSNSDVFEEIYTALQLMPALLAQRFMLNLRLQRRAGAVGEGSSSASSSDFAHHHHPSRFSANLKMPSDFLGNIGEPLGDGLEEEREQVQGEDGGNRGEGCCLGGGGGGGGGGEQHVGGLETSRRCAGAVQESPVAQCGGGAQRDGSAC